MMRTVHFLILRWKGFTSIHLIMAVFFKCRNPFWPLGLKYAVYFLCTGKCYITMVNLLKIVWVSCFEYRSGIEHVRFLASIFLLWWLYFCVLCVGFIRDCFYLYKGIYKLIGNRFGDDIVNGRMLMILQI